MASLSVSLLGSFLAGLVALFVLDQPWWVPAVVAVVAFVVTGGWAPAKKLYKALLLDYRFIRDIKSKVLDPQARHRSRKLGMGDVFSKVVKRHPDKTAMIFEDQKWTFQDLEDMSNKIANYFKSAGLQSGDSVALFAHNCPQYTAVVLGLGRLGVRVALINFNLRHDSLLHCINVIDCRLVLFDAALSDALNDVRSELGSSLLGRSYCISGESSLAGSVSLEKELDGVSAVQPPPYENKSANDIFCYIYTSGTTGYPKACCVKHTRFFSITHTFAKFIPLTSEDVAYVALPFYHTTGGIIGLSGMLVKGCTLVVKRKFSASLYWSDVAKYNCTVVYYIGELCRYLLAQPQRETDTQHKVRLAIGNGLRPEIWESFKNRFQMDQIIEFYGATEGNTAYFNIYNKVGSVGRSLMMPGLPKGVLVNIDHGTGEPIRNSQGFCSKVKVNEPGLLVCPLQKVIPFDGYHDKKATDKKILQNVFKAGDKYFNSGDVLRMDEDGFMYFCDRSGDTFRWKGENVSTTEVEATMSNVLQLQDVIVYGVRVQGMDGRAGMAAIAGSEESVDLDDLSAKLFLLLPHYAVPRFVRFGSTEVTGTFKLKKTKLREEGFDLTRVSDPLYMLDLTVKRYVPLTQALQEKLLQGALRL